MEVTPVISKVYTNKPPKVSETALKQQKSTTVEETRVKQPKAPSHVKKGVLLTTALGVASGVAISFKRSGHSINPIKIAKDFKNSGFAKLDYNWKDILTISTSSVAGGLVGGAIFDKKENMKAKIREATTQMLANIIIPLMCVAGGTKAFNKTLKEPLLKFMKQVSSDGKALLKGKVASAMDVVITALTLATGIFAGNKASNLLNEKIYNIKDDRKVKLADMSGHVDDTCLAISTGFGPENPIAKVVSRIIPLALLICGYSTGCMQEWPDDIKESRKADPSKPFRL